MSSSEENNQLNNEERLKGIAYQFLKLYERWSEDRQIFNKNMAKHEELLNTFVSQLKNFENLEFKVREQLINNIHHTIKNVSQETGKMVGESITREINDTVHELKRGVHEASEELKDYQRVIRSNLVAIIGITLVAAISTSLFIVWLLMPSPKLPLTDDQMGIYHDGQFLDNFWQKLSKKEQQHLTDLAKAPDPIQSNSNNVSNNGFNTDDNQ